LNYGDKSVKCIFFKNLCRFSSWPLYGLAKECDRWAPKTKTDWFNARTK